jgi:Flp pilus assembly protein TadD
MVEDDVEDSGSAGHSSGESAALGIAMTEAARDASVAEEAREFLREQTEVLRLQKEVLKEERQLNLSHLRHRRFSDLTKTALEVAGFLVVLLIVCGIGTMVWNASQDRDLVVDAFSVPQDVAQTGLTGSVLAGRVLDRFGRMQADVSAFTQGASSYRAQGADSVRVEIPETGISLSELNQYLRAWLGHEVHVSGDLVHTPDGLALTTRFGSQPGTTVAGKVTDLDKLTEKAAEQIFAAALPYRHIEYLVHEYRFAEASALLPDLATRGTPAERAVAGTAWAKTYFSEGDIPHALERGREAARLDPQNAIAFGWLGATEEDLGHDEASYANIDKALKLFGEQAGADETVYFHEAFRAYRDEPTGDYADAVSVWNRLSEIGPLYNDGANATDDAVSDHDLAAARRFLSLTLEKDASERASLQPPTARFYIDVFLSDWSAAVMDGARAYALQNSRPNEKWIALSFVPDLAYAIAKNGDLRRADTLLVSVRQDCDPCMRARGRIAALENRWDDAAHDFALVAARSPHEPFAETYWGQMLIARGDLDAAIAKFREANLKGPHFADPLEMWGEALTQQNRSDLALAKFEEAGKYAPNWGRLHLEWGKALLYVGKKNDAQKQFRHASLLDLSQADKAALARWVSGHG